MIKPAENVTAENFHFKSDAYCSLSKEDGEGYGVIIKRQTHKAQWAAWMDYFKGLGLGVRYMSRCDQYQVPALWPHLFDAKRDKALDDYFKDAGLTFKGSTSPNWTKREDA